MNILFLEDQRSRFYPLTHTRPIQALKVGILSLEEKWNILIEQHIHGFTKKKVVKIYICPTVIPSKKVINQILSLEDSEILSIKGKPAIYFDSKENKTSIEIKDAHQIQCIPDIIYANQEQITEDLTLLNFSKNKIKSPAICIGDQIYGGKDIDVNYAIFDASQGPIVLGKNVTIMPGAILRGPLYIGDYSVIKMGAKIYGNTSIGKHCKIGGEVSQSIFLGYSNKSHDGYLGHSYIGEWCNLGAGTNCSNLKNNYSTVKYWRYDTSEFKNSNRQFLGLIMGDHSKSAIGSSFNTGSVVGCFCNVFSHGFLDKFIPDFSWVGTQKQEHQFDKAILTAQKVMARRNLKLSERLLSIYKNVFTMTKKHRTTFLN